MIHITVTDRELKWTAIVIGILILASGILAQSPPQDKFKPSEVQHLRLENAQLKAINAQQQMTEACGSPGAPGVLAKEFSARLQALSDEAVKVRRENSWPDSVVFNNQDLSFAEQPPPTKPADAPKQEGKP
jgi:hypothetical protein